MIFDIRKPMPFQTGLYRLNKNADYNFQLNRLINMDGADKKLVERIARRIHDDASWKSVLLKCAEKLDSAGNIRMQQHFTVCRNSIWNGMIPMRCVHGNGRENYLCSIMQAIFRAKTLLWNYSKYHMKAIRCRV